MGVEEIASFLSRVDMLYVYLAVLIIAYVENIFPPFPSDVIVVFAGSLVAIGKGNVLLTLLLATFGSTTGFLTMFWIGGRVGHAVLDSGKLRFLSRDLISKVERWFGRYGYYVIIANRFLAGTRAVVSFCAGVAGMNVLPTTLLSAVSALVWNTILVYLGLQVGENWREISEYLATYSTIVSLLLLLVVVAVLSRYIWVRNPGKKPR